jgi:hypothetical protein
MTSKSIMSFLLGLGLFLAPLSMAGAGEVPPPGSKPLSAILKSLEGQELGVFTSTEFDDGWWEVKVCKAGACQKLYIDPKSGEEKRRRKADSDDALPPANAKSLSAIVQSIEDRGMGTIMEVEFDDGFWKVELRKDGRKIKLDVDPKTGETRR